MGPGFGSTPAACHKPGSVWEVVGSGSGDESAELADGFGVPPPHGVHDPLGVKLGSQGMKPAVESVRTEATLSGSTPAVKISTSSSSRRTIR